MTPEEAHSMREAIVELKIANAQLTIIVGELTKRLVKQESNWDWLIKIIGALIIAAVLVGSGVTAMKS